MFNSSASLEGVYPHTSTFKREIRIQSHLRTSELFNPSAIHIAYNIILACPVATMPLTEAVPRKD